MPTPPAIAAAAVIASIGINTHIDFNNYGYQNRTAVARAINYLGVKNLRDSAGNPSDVETWPQVAHATGARFDDFIGETSPAGMATQLALAPRLAQEGVLDAIEGGNEEDDAYPRSLGNSVRVTGQFQQRVYAMGRSLGLPVINMSFGSGWTAANDWHGDYDKVGDLSAYATYANAHTYPVAGQTTGETIRRLNDDARLAAANRPVMTTEIGWDTGGTGAAVQGVVQAVLDGIKAGDARMYFYALFDDMSGKYGLMNADGSPRPAGAALHNLTTLLADGGGRFTPGSLPYRLSGTAAGDDTLLMQKSDGSFWLAVWNESADGHQVTVDLGEAASRIAVFDPVTGTSAMSSSGNAGHVTVELAHDPLLIEIVPGTGSKIDAVR
ncbi:MAG TPA: hypothetical protein VMB73_07485 [Acetobacteraceae bacterium]|nr:hypothetical protein [Acetobacteraceae bacterium]